MSVQWNTVILFFVLLVTAVVGAQFVLFGFQSWWISFAQNSKDAKIAEPSFPPATTFRLQGIPELVSEQPICQKEVSKLVREAWNLGHDVHLTIYSLSADPFDDKRKVATLTFQQVPACFRPPQQVWTASSTNSDGTAMFLQLDLNFLGFTPLHSTSDRDCTVDIVALSGLNGHAFGSFKERGRDKCFMWLRDILPDHFPHARVFIYGYDSKLTDTQNFQEIPDLALNFRNDMSNLVVAKPRQLILIGHSLGGIIVKEALIQMKTAKDANDAWSYDAKAMLRRISALLFFGAPSEGLDNEVLELMAKGQPNDRLVKSLGRSSGVLRTQMVGFRRVFEELDFLTIWYYELENTPTPRLSDKGQWKKTGEFRKLVEPTSATNGNPHDFGRHLVRGISRNHSEMVKLQGIHDHVYKTIRGDLEKCFSREHNDEQILSSEQKDILNTIAYPGEDFRRDNVDRAMDHTCEWFFSSKKFFAWKESSKSNSLDNVLWIKGKPGTGKSTLMLEAVRYTQKHFTGEPTTVISFFFHARGKILENSPLGLYRSLLHQLLSQDPGSWKALSSIFKAKQKGKQVRNISWSQQDLKECLIQAFKSVECNPAVIFIDALDECPDDDGISVVDFFMDLTRQTRKTDNSLRICFSSRHYPNISTCGFPELVMEQENAGDIRIYIRSELHDRLPNYDDLFELQEIIFRKSSSVFLWVKLVTTRLKRVVIRQPGQTRHALEKELAKFPSELEELFSGLFSTLSPDDRKKATLLIQLILCARRELSIEEIIAILPYHPQSLYTTFGAWEHSEDYISGKENQKIMITRLSCGLLEFNSFGCQFIHETAREFFLRPRNVNVLSWSRTPMDIVAGSNDAIVNASIDYLQAFVQEYYDDIRDWIMFEVGRIYPLINYIARYLYDHIEAAEIGGISQEVALKFLEKLDDEITEHLKYANTTFESRPGWTQLYGCCTTGWRRFHTISRLIQMEQNPEVMINKLCRRSGSSPLIAAVSATGDNKEVVNLLLVNGARVDIRDNTGANALQMAILGGHLAIAEILLSYGADADFVYDGRRLLSCAEPLLCYTARTDKREAAELLLRHGANVDKENKAGETPIIVAGSSMSLKVFPVLVKAGANVNSKDRMGAVPLQSAYEKLCRMPHDLGPSTYEAVKSCIEAGQDLEMLCEGNKTLLEALLDWSEVIGKGALDGDQRAVLKQIVCLLTGGKA